MPDSLSQTIRSDYLADLREFAEVFEHPLFSELLRMVQLEVILDANIMLSEIYWLCKKRKNPKARTSLLEVLECRVLRGYAPDFIHEEMNKHIPLHAEKYGIQEADMWKEWERLQKFITVMPVPPEYEEWIESDRDAKDRPYLALQKKIQRSIYSKDGDIEAMGGTVIHEAVIISLRDYARHAAVEYSIKFVGAGTLVVSQKIIEATAQSLKNLSAKLKSVPLWVIWLVAILMIVSLLHPRTRGMAEAAITVFCISVGKVGTQLLAIVGALAKEHYEAQEKAAPFLNEVKQSVMHPQADS